MIFGSNMAESSPKHKKNMALVQFHLAINDGRPVAGSNRSFSNYFLNFLYPSTFDYLADQTLKNTPFSRFVARMRTNLQFRGQLSPEMEKKMSTKNQSFKNLKKSGRLAELDGQVLAAIEAAAVMGQTPTRHDIEESQDMYMSSVCGAVRRLIDAGLIVEVGSRKNPETGKNNKTLAPFRREAANAS